MDGGEQLGKLLFLDSGATEEEKESEEGKNQTKSLKLEA
jgi:hypothetical protein